ncbi:hypothetical protein ACQP25_44950 (plasmid) [Microtetraspora malaysiensis]|uniref:hypothetical protein n=1 Tax=Microtetraspora malaysiensis TaxID=161358 RepID=UPI003D9319BA
MAERKTYLYRLNVEYPPGSDEWGWEPPGWQHNPIAQVIDPETGGHECASFSWPTVRPYLSQSAAKRRADLLRSYGAVVTIQRSQPIAWERVPATP